MKATTLAFATLAALVLQSCKSDDPPNVEVAPPTVKTAPTEEEWKDLRKDVDSLTGEQKEKLEQLVIASSPGLQKLKAASDRNKKAKEQAEAEAKKAKEQAEAEIATRNRLKAWHVKPFIDKLTEKEIGQIVEIYEAPVKGRRDHIVTMVLLRDLNGEWQDALLTVRNAEDGVQFPQGMSRIDILIGDKVHSFKAKVSPRGNNVMLSNIEKLVSFFTSGEEFKVRAFLSTDWGSGPKEYIFTILNQGFKDITQ